MELGSLYLTQQAGFCFVFFQPKTAIIFETLDTKEKQEGLANPLCWKNTDRDDLASASQDWSQGSGKMGRPREVGEEIGIDTLDSESHF